MTQWRFRCPDCKAVLLVIPATTGSIRQDRKCPTCNRPVLIEYAERRALREVVEE